MTNVLDEVVLAQERGEARGLVSVCSAHPWVLRAVGKYAKAGQVIVEATCNQVNQFGGYTGMRPADFVRYVVGFGLPGLLGGDHLGPSVWQAEPAESAMAKADELVRGYVQAGFTKIHVDASMRLGDDPAGPLPVEVCARRAARLVRAAEAVGSPDLRYVIGSEVPVPGGAHAHEAGVAVTMPEGVRETMDATRAAFRQAGVENAWERVRAVVVQPGVEFGEAFVLDYQTEKARGLARFIEGTGMVYEAHSTDYQTPEALRALVRDHFAILKVGPALTFAFREAVFALAMMEGEMVPRAGRSNLIEVLDAAMVEHPAHWRKYYRGTAEEQAFKRKFSLSDRARYYWGFPEVQAALARLLENLRGPLPLALLSQFVPGQGARVRAGVLLNVPDALILDRIGEVLRGYLAAVKAMD